MRSSLIFFLFQRDRAEKVLEEAIEVTKALDDADDAQKKARQSIKRANEDIQSAKIDLEEVILLETFTLEILNKLWSFFQIDKETDDAHKRANGTASKVEELKTRLNKLHVSNVQNDQDAEEIIKQAETVKESANTAHDLATQVSFLSKAKHPYFTILSSSTISAEGQLQNCQRITDGEIERFGERSGAGTESAEPCLQDHGWNDQSAQEASRYVYDPNLATFAESNHLNWIHPQSCTKRTNRTRTS